MYTAFTFMGLVTFPIVRYNFYMKVRLVYVEKRQSDAPTVPYMRLECGCYGVQ